MEFFYNKISRSRSVIYLLLCLGLGIAVIMNPVIKPLKLVHFNKAFKWICDIPGPVEELLAWIKNNTSRKSRILVEDSDVRSKHQFYDTYLPAVFPNLVQREYLVGPRPNCPILHGFASFTEEILFGKHINDFSFNEIKNYFDLYNVGWVICWSDASKTFFQKYPKYLRHVKDIDKFSIYQVHRTPSFFLKGAGEIQSDYNRLSLTEIVPQDGEIVIKYHWMKYLKTKPERKIEQFFAGDDPVGFIKIMDPPASLIVYNAY
jgi:hypothetical protein